MALYNEILTGRYARALQKLTSIKGGAPARQLSGDIMPTFPFEDSESVELRYINSWDRFSCTPGQAAGGAGNFACVRLRNPAGSNLIVVVEMITVSSASADSPNVRVGTAAADLANIQTLLGNLDTRGRPKPTAIVSYQSNGAAPVLTGEFGFWTGNMPVNYYTTVIGTENEELTVLPGSALQINCGTANTNQICSLLWRERALEESERS